ncbi:MAG: hypothetical protein H6922_06240 [Pseudomonadaceae bacterium]|nr:hypothetical protein [Pseudomonadaceae bacterium]
MSSMIRYPCSNPLVQRAAEISSALRMPTPVIYQARESFHVAEIAYAEIYEHDDLSLERRIVLSHELATHAPPAWTRWVLAHELAELRLPLSISGFRREFMADRLAARFEGYETGIAIFNHLITADGQAADSLQYYDDDISTHPSLVARIIHLQTAQQRHDSHTLK